jgi:hypothetical protein
MSTPAIVGPVPPYSNVNINAQFYEPSAFFISAIALGITTTVTTTVNHNYLVGQEVRLIIPPTFGSRQLNERSGFVLSIPAANQVVLSINSSMNVDAFQTSSAKTQPQILAIGDVNLGVTNVNGRSSTGTFIPGSFINIS